MVDSPQLEGKVLSCLSRLPSLERITIADCSPDAFVLLTMGAQCSQLTSITLYNNQLDANTMAAMSPATWSDLVHGCLDCNMLGVMGMHYLMSCSLPSLQTLSLQQTGINGSALQCASQGRWPALKGLKLARNNLAISIHLGSRDEV